MSYRLPLDKTAAVKRYAPLLYKVPSFALIILPAFVIGWLVGIAVRAAKLGFSEAEW